MDTSAQPDCSVFHRRDLLSRNGLGNDQDGFPTPTNIAREYPQACLTPVSQASLNSDRHQHNQHIVAPLLVDLIPKRVFMP